MNSVVEGAMDSDLADLGNYFTFVCLYFPLLESGIHNSTHVRGCREDYMRQPVSSTYASAWLNKHQLFLLLLLSLSWARPSFATYYQMSAPEVSTCAGHTRGSW